MTTPSEDEIPGSVGPTTSDVDGEAQPRRVGVGSSPPASEIPPRATSAAGDGEDASSAPTAPTEVDAPPMSLAVPGASSQIAPASRTLRFVYWMAWFVFVPFLLAVFVVWSFTPPSGIEPTGVFGPVRSFVREQPVPVTIVVFTIFEMAFWSLRHRLPLSRHAHPPLRSGVHEELREPFEKARLLLDEARAILEKNAGMIGSSIGENDLDALKASLRKLEKAMDLEPFDVRIFSETLLAADEIVNKHLSPWRKSELREYVESIAFAVIVALLLRSFVFEAFKIPSGSMIPTLQVGDHIFVNKFSYGPAIPFTKARLWTNMPPKRGDVMVFAFPEDKELDFIKRVVALPGDELRTEGGHPIINGWRVPNCPVGEYSYTEENGEQHTGDLFVEYLEDEAYVTLYDRARASAMQGPFLVQQGEVWVMGDNRHNSHDSRLWRGGLGAGVPFENIRGRALFVWVNVAAGKGFDWSRIGAPVMGRPRLPPNMKRLDAGIERCLKNRPPLDQTHPPSKYKEREPGK